MAIGGVWPLKLVRMPMLMPGNQRIPFYGNRCSWCLAVLPFRRIQSNACASYLSLAGTLDTKNFYIAALVPLFPSFGLFSYYIVGRARGIGDMKTTVVFGMFSLIPYLAFLMTLYLSAERLKLVFSLPLLSLVWLVAAVVLVLLWNGLRDLL